MQYISTRASGTKQEKRTFLEILLEGLAPDGGLYMPEAYPKVTDQELTAWRKLSYVDLAFEVLGKFISDIPKAVLKSIVQKTDFH